MMTIYILDSDPKKIAEAIDDKSLDKMIKDIAQVLMSLHIALKTPGYSSFNFVYKNSEWLDWARECFANYKYLVELLWKCLAEQKYRYELPQNIPSKWHDYWDILEWASDNVPDLPIIHSSQLLKKNPKEGTPFPLVMPEKYQIADLSLESSIEGALTKKNEFDPRVRSYRNYYHSKLTKRTICAQCEYQGSAKHIHKKDGYKMPIWTRREKPEWLNLSEY